jgi:hypothetical protein
VTSRDRLVPFADKLKKRSTELSIKNLRATGLNLLEQDRESGLMIKENAEH